MCPGVYLLDGRRLRRAAAGSCRLPRNPAGAAVPVPRAPHRAAQSPQPEAAHLPDAGRRDRAGPALPNWTYRRLPPEPESPSLAGLMVSDARVARQLPRLVHPMRYAMFLLMDDAYRCPVKELHVVVSQRGNLLLATVRSRIIDQHVGCIDRP